MRSWGLLFFGAMFLACSASAYNALDNDLPKALQVTATVQASPAQITLSWPGKSSAKQIYVFRKAKDATSWGAAIATLPNTATSYTDTSVAVGTGYEYWVRQDSASAADPQGFIYAGIEVPVVHSRGKVIVLIAADLVPGLGSDLDTLQRDLVGDGWQILRHDIPDGTTVAQVKAIIKADYDADPTNVKAVYILGHVPVPYSGDIAPDGHNDHRGAWPADAFYGDMDGSWTDSTVNRTSATRNANHNVPGDGKYDQGTLDGTRALELFVGRVDLIEMNMGTEVELLKRYINKAHNFRNNKLAVTPRANVKNAFALAEPFSYAGWALASLLGTENVEEFDFGNSTAWINDLATNDHLWVYGAGPGSYQGVGEVCNQQDFNSVRKAQFYILFGSYFGDWDNNSNVLRAPLCSPTYGLASVWSGRPHWYFHHMGLGEPIGHALKPSTSNIYKTASSLQGVHLALMGDPTLRMKYVAPPSDVDATGLDATRVEVYWTASVEPGVAGYYVYRAASMDSAFSRISPSLVAGTSFVDDSPLAGNNVYMARAVKLETGPSGSYYNMSTGQFAEFVSGVVAIKTSVASLSVPEGGTSTFQVRLSIPPAASVAVTVARFSGDGDLSVTGGASLTFTTGNWRVYQTVTIAAAEDADALIGNATIRCSSPAATTRDVIAYEVENDAPSQTPYGGTARAIPGRIEIEDYDVGGEGVSWHDADAGNAGNFYRTADDVDIQQASHRSNGAVVGWVSSGEWLEYTVAVASSASYALSAVVATPDSGRTMHVEVDGVNVSGTMNVPNTGNWDAWQAVTKSGIFLTQGEHIVRVVMETGGHNIDYLQFEAEAPSTTGVLALSAATYTVAENGGSATITVTRTGGSSGAASVQYATGNGTATAGSDYTSASGTLNWADGNAADRTFTIAIANDALDEANETVNITLANAAGASMGTPNTAVLTIIDDDAAPTVAFTAVSQSKAESAGTATITAQLSVVSGQAVTVPYTLSGTATGGGTDYSITASPVTIPAGSTTADITVTIVDDAIYENPDETVIVTMGTPTNALLGAATIHILTILDNDSVPPSSGVLALSAATYTVAEDGGSATITVKRTGGSSGAASVQYATSDGTATAGADYTAASGTLNWADGDAADKTFGITILDDGDVEGDETVNITLANAVGATLGTPAAAVLTIADDESDPQGPYGGTARAIPGRIEAEDYDEGGEGVAYHDADPENRSGAYRTDGVDVKAEGNASNGHCVDWTTENEWLEYTVDIAAAGAYTFRARVASTNSGKSLRAEIDGVDVTGSVSVPNTGGWSDWGLAEATGVNLPEGRRILRIFIETSDFNIDYVEFESVTPTVAFTAAAYAIDEFSPAATIAVRRTGDNADPVSVQYATGDGSATAGADYVVASGVLTWAAGDSADKTFAVPILNDALLEGDETVVLTLLNAVGAIIAAPQPATLTIIDDESALQGPYGGTPWPVPGRIEAEDYDVGGEGIAWHDADLGNSSGAYRSDDVEIKAEGVCSNGHCVEFITLDDWLEYTIEVAATGTYDLTVAVATPASGKSLRLEVDRVDVTGSVAVPNTGGWSEFQTVVVTGIRLTAGPHILRVVMETSDFSFDYIQLDWVPPPTYTVVFRATVGGLVDGVAALTQTVTEGGDCTPVTAQPEAGYEFAGWTGNHIGTENPLTLRNVLGDMTVTATFAPAGYVVTFLAEAHGTVNGMTEVTFTVVHGGSAPSVAAVGDEGHSFAGWIGDHAGLENPLTLAGVVDDMTVTATFAINEYRVAFETDGTPGATLSGDLLQTVTHGGDCTPVAVEALPGFEFLGWTGDHVGAENPLTITNVTSDLTVVAAFGQRFTVGSTLGIGAELVTGLDAFRLKPKVYAVYRDPVSQIPGKKASLKVLGKIDKANGTDPVVSEWTKKIKLVNGKLFKARQKLGEGAADWLSDPANQIPLVLDLHLATKEAEPPDQRILGGQLPPPEIDTVEFGLPDAKGNQTLVITGKWFGTKKPKVWREYTVPEKGPAIKQQKCKVAAPADPAFKDSKGKLSCMQHDTGDSQVIVVLPPPKGVPNGTLVLDNGVGMAVAIEP